MPHTRRASFHSSLTLAGVAALVAAVLIPSPVSAADDPPAPLPAVPPAASIARTTPGAPAPTDQFIVKFKNPAAAVPAERAKAFGRAAAKVGMQVKDVRATSGGARVLRASKKLGAADAGKLLASLRADPAVASAEADAIMQAKAAPPNDPHVPFQWNLFQEPAGLRVAGAWGVTRGAGEVVAVVDTGITSHIDLNANVLPGYDMISDPAEARDGDKVRDPDPTDEGDWASSGQCGIGSPPWDSSWHGTHVAGVIAAVTGNAEGIAGVAPQAKVLPVRALGPCGGYTSDIMDAVLWAAGAAVRGVPANPNPARVINLSLGGAEPCLREFQQTIDTVNSLGAVVVVAAGNESQPASNSNPANCEGVISVAASGRTGALAPYSNFGPAVDVTAPGGDMEASAQDGILSTLNDGATFAETEAYYFAQGTSMAAPHVAGAAALLMAKMGSAATPAAVEARLKATARPMPGGCQLGCGAGLVDAAAAVLPDRSHITMIVAAGDLNSDRKPDVLARDTAGVLWLYPGNGRGGLLTRIMVGGGWNGMTAVVGPGDMNRDGKADVLARDTGGTLWMYPGNGGGRLLTRVMVGGGWNVMTAVVGPGDMNGDGKADVLARDFDGTLWLYPGSGSNGLLRRVQAGAGWNVMTAMVGPGDMNGDRKTDVLARDSRGNLWLYPGNGGGGLLRAKQAGVGWNGMTAIVGRGDFNGDLRNDLLAVDTAGILWLFRGNGTGGWLGKQQAGTGWN
ncbi:S8 family serine peptidase [Arthrobacter sp. ISL-28]|uniref:S8 family serine peptidase n=1 Tax=Arthrobacter sp. ISL-28 TaxID=2819108 RepID=UPI001BEB2135|nr:S8 family serine peptidase [Arthrobacter sp. ISL-28]MBT2519621.1 S8 family serine peptidase [Arthrobacter sp. ISL-28]